MRQIPFLLFFCSLATLASATTYNVTYPGESVATIHGEILNITGPCFYYLMLCAQSDNPILNNTPTLTLPPRCGPAAVVFANADIPVGHQECVITYRTEEETTTTTLPHSNGGGGGGSNDDIPPDYTSSWYYGMARPLLEKIAPSTTLPPETTTTLPMEGNGESTIPTGSETTQVTHSSLPPITTSTVATTTTLAVPAPAPADDGNTWILLGGILVLVAIIVLLNMFIMLWKKRKAEKQSESQDPKPHFAPSRPFRPRGR